MTMNAAISCLRTDVRGDCYTRCCCMRAPRKYVMLRMPATGCGLARRRKSRMCDVCGWWLMRLASFRTCAKAKFWKPVRKWQDGRRLVCWICAEIECAPSISSTSLLLVPLPLEVVRNNGRKLVWRFRENTRRYSVPWFSCVRWWTPKSCEPARQRCDQFLMLEPSCARRL